MTVGYQLLLHVMDQIRNSMKAHEKHEPTGVSSATSVTVEGKAWTSQMVKARDGQEEGSIGSRVRTLRSHRETKESKDFTEFICSDCKKSFSSQRGLSMHLYHQRKERSGCTGVDPGMGNSPQAAHQSNSSSAQNHKATIWNYAQIHSEVLRPSGLLKDFEMRPRIKLPNNKSTKYWKKLDEEIYTSIVSSIPKVELDKGMIQDVFTRFTDIVYNTAVAICGLEQKQEKRQAFNQVKRPPKLLQQLKLAKKNARKEFRRAKRGGTDVLAAYKEFMKAVRAHHDLVKSLKKSEKERKKYTECEKFLSNPHRYAKNLLNPPAKGKPKFSRDIANEYFKQTYSDSDRSFTYQPPFDLPRPPLPEHPFNVQFASFEEFSTICWRKSNSSAPGPNGIPYLLYKRCPETRKILWSLLQRMWKEKFIPKEFQIGRVCLLAKSEDASHPKSMRPISILNSEGRLFWTVFHSRLSKFMIENKYIQVKMQKGFLEGVAGCIEHTAMQTEMLLNAKENERAIAMAWLDLENAYGSVRHMLIQFAFKWFHIPTAMAELIFRYYDSMFLKVVTSEWTSESFHLAIGVPQGCTASTIVFDVAFQLTLDIYKWLTRSKDVGYKFTGADISVIAPTYADDIELITSTGPKLQSAVDAFQSGLQWTRTLRLKPSKCRVLAFRKFRKDEKQTLYKRRQDTMYSSYDPLITINGQRIKFVGDDEPALFKHLGLLIQADLKEDVIQEQVEKKLIHWLELVENSLIDGRMKAWVVNFCVCAKLAWLLMVQGWSGSVAKKWQQIIHRRYRRWLGLAKPAEKSVLYRPKEHFGLQLKDLQEVQRQLRLVKWHLVKTSKDEEMRKLYRYRLERDKKGHIGTGRKHSPCLDVERLEREQQLDAMSARAQSDRRGLGFNPIPDRKSNPRADLVYRLKSEAEHKRLVILHQYEMQADWLSWGLDNMMMRDLSWNTIIYQCTQRLLKFVLNSQQNTLPTPDNLRRWNLNKDAVCGLCGGRAVTLSHVLAGCTWVRTVENKLHREDRFTWRHNNILYLLATAISEHVKVSNANRSQSSANQVPLIKFVRAGEKMISRSKTKRPSLLSGANDWICNFDLPEFQRSSSYCFPHEVCLTPLRIDGYIISRTARVCIGLELTSPMEENIGFWHKSKLQKYEEEIRLAAKQNGWTFHVLILEIGARGWIPPSVPNSLRKLGIPSNRITSLCNQLTLLALKSSYVIYLNRFNKEFQPWRLTTTIPQR